MNRLEKLVQAFSVAKGAMDSVFLRNRPAPWEEGDAQLFSNVYTKSDISYVCISTTAKAISQAPLQVEIKVDEDAYEYDGNSEWNTRILNKPNYLIDGFNFKIAIVSYLLMSGDAFIVPFPPEYVEYPDSLWVVSKNTMKPIKNKETGQLEYWDYSPDGRRHFSLDIKDVCHSWFFNPDDPIMGLAPHEAGRIPISTDYRTAKFNQLFFKQGASSTGVFHTEQKLGPEQYDAMLQRIRQRHSGMRNAHTDMLLHSGLKYDALTRSHRDMEFGEGRKYDAARIMQIYGMKKSIISVTDDINRATAYVDRRNWWEGTNLPIMKLIESALTFTFFGLDDSRRFKFDISNVEALKEEYTEKVDNARRLFRVGVPFNQLNKKLELGFDEPPHGDISYISAGLVPLDEDGMPIRQNVRLPSGGSDDAEEDIPDDEVEDESEDAGDTVLIGDDKSLIEEIGVWKSLIRRAEPIEAAYESKVGKAFFAIRQNVVKWLYNNAKSSKDAFILTEPFDQAFDNELAVKPLEVLKSEADTLYERSMMEGLRSLAGEIGVAPDPNIMSRPEAVSYLRDRTSKVTGLGRNIKIKISEQIQLGMQNEEDIEKVVKRVRKVFKAARNRATTIARTETFSAVNHGRHLMAMESDHMEVKWFTSLDSSVRHSHAGMHGATKRKDEMWLVNGASLRYPADYEAGFPSETINCRCIETVVL